MKPNTKRWIGLVLTWAFYNMGILGGLILAEQYHDYRVAVGATLALNMLVALVALVSFWRPKFKETVTVGLVAAFLCLPLNIHADDPPKPKFETYICGVEFVAIFLFTYAWYCSVTRAKYWDPSMTTDPPPGFNDPYNPITDEPPTLSSAHLVAESVNYSGACSTAPYTNVLSFVMRSSVDLTNWVVRSKFKCWQSPVGSLMLQTTAEGVPVWTNFAHWPNGNYMPYQWPAPVKQHENFRVVAQ